MVGAWHGIAASHSLWLVPEIVLKGVTAIVTSLSTASLAYFILSDFSVVGRLIAENSSWDYYEEKATVDMAALIGIAIGAAFSMAQFWLLLILIHTYSTIRTKEVNRQVHKLRTEAKRQNNGAKKEHKTTY